MPARHLAQPTLLLDDVDLVLADRLREAVLGRPLRRRRRAHHQRAHARL